MSDESRVARVVSRAMGVFGEVRPAEVAAVAAMFANLTLLLLGYYILKTAREPMILATGGAEMKAYAAGVQAVVLMGFVPLYGWLSSRVDRMKLIVGLNAFFFVCIQLFWLGATFEVPHLGFVFFVWVGIFSLSTIAQFWSFANEAYEQRTADRIFPIIAIGATVGAPVGSALAAFLFDSGVEARTLLQIAAALLAAHTLLYLVCRRALGERHVDQTEKPLRPVGGFKLVFQDGYLRLIAALLILLNLVNTTGEYILSVFVTEAAEIAQAADAAVTVEGYIGSFYGEFFSIVNVVTIGLQALLAPRLTHRFGLAGILFILPVIALGTYGLAAAGIGFAAFRWAKTAENSSDYSFMNTAKAMVWLPTSAEAKYKAKQAIDTFFVRFGDVLSAGVVWIGTTYFAFELRQFAILNVAVAAVFLLVTVFVWRRYRRLSGDDDKRANEPALA